MKWTSVQDRLPPKAGHYLCISNLNYYHGGCWDLNKDGTSKSIVVAYYDGTDKVGGKHYWNHSHIVAWQELPEIDYNLK